MSDHPIRGSIRFGLCADPHKDIMHDTDTRLQAFVDAMNHEQVDFILQLGDFCRPYDYNRGFMEIWESFDGPRYHVLGNHDTDGGFTREQTMAYWNMPARYYSFDIRGYHFVILDGNDRWEGAASGYPRYMAADQLAWLREDLDRTDAPTFLFSHQSLENQGGIENGNQVRELLEEVNEEAGWRKVVACFSGHHHIDDCVRIGSVDYIQVNSMSNYWLGEQYLCIRYSAEIDEQFPWIKYTAPYKDPLYSLVALEPEGILVIEGRESEFVGPSPWELGYSREDLREKLVPATRPRTLVWR